ncbi:Cupin 2 conserved barrel domain protein [Thermobaculum terrenum ATCC BAA-798]|uniref:Cupin 2 conserved barrel domain protein n=1 Tax=Thermobaculum terrenum (strain ATCC BAA-798 / CCMEE 7001 / YNP1) TaxID=525904 RepID=D1CBS1_THET1|nr:cupin domain-containing protein [Thermobaculum terrenum]ACZ42236.1 Cupin 2 conserved barrel domain protein [Thermobaculum terrenum ATCC BAA-798]
MHPSSESSRQFLHINVLDFLQQSTAGKVLWAHQTEDLNINLVHLDAGASIDRHHNNEVDVLILVIQGEGKVEIDDAEISIRSGDLLVIPKAAQRSIAATKTNLLYVTCHRRRHGLMPTIRDRH